MKKRYERNMMTLSEEENAKLKDFKICVVGCGGLGGYVIELLGRLGIGHLTVIDGDVFEESNLNRQILSDETVLGQSKAEIAKERMAKVNSDINVKAIHAFVTAENCEQLISGHDVVVDALDNIDSRFILEKGASTQNIPLVHGAIAGWYGQVSVIMPGNSLFKLMYPEQIGKEGKGIEKGLGNPSFIPALVAAIQTSETIKLLLGKEGVLVGKLLNIDLLTQEYDIFELNSGRL